MRINNEKIIKYFFQEQIQQYLKIDVLKNTAIKYQKFL